MQEKIYTVDEKEKNQRLDTYVASLDIHISSLVICFPHCLSYK